MMYSDRKSGRRITALVLALGMALPLVASLPAQAQLSGGNPTPSGQGMSTRKKVVLLAGAALLYYLYKKHQAAQSARGTATAGKQGQLYRSRNGGVYYRDAQGKPVWLTVPQQGVQVPADEVQRYAPDYSRYRGPAPAAPAGYRTQPFDQFDSGSPSRGTMTAPRGPSGPGQ